MKKIKNPTEYFFEKLRENEQQNEVDLMEIQRYVGNLIDQEKCGLCYQFYGLQERIPRILVHCGHTFCTECLQGFHLNDRVRCPMCLKLIKNIFAAELLPMNHTIIRKLLHKKLTSEQQQQQPNTNIAQKIQSYLYSQFQTLMRENLKMMNKCQMDKNLCLPYCVYHKQKIEQYFCLFHETAGCQQCMNQGHTTNKLCKVVNAVEIRNQQEQQSKQSIQLKQQIQQIQLGGGQIKLKTSVSIFQQYSSSSNSSQSS